MEHNISRTRLCGAVDSILSLVDSCARLDTQPCAAFWAATKWFHSTIGAAPLLCSSRKAIPRSQRMRQSLWSSSWLPSTILWIRTVDRLYVSLGAYSSLSSRQPQTFFEHVHLSVVADFTFVVFFNVESINFPACTLQCHFIFLLGSFLRLQFKTPMIHIRVAYCRTTVKQHNDRGNDRQRIAKQEISTMMGKKWQSLLQATVFTLLWQRTKTCDPSFFCRRGEEPCVFLRSLLAETSIYFLSFLQCRLQNKNCRTLPIN